MWLFHTDQISHPLFTSLRSIKNTLSDKCSCHYPGSGLYKQRQSTTGENNVEKKNWKSVAAHLLHITPHPAYLECVDESQVVERDVIIVVLDVTKCLLVVLHQRVDLPILALLNLMDFCLAPQIQLISQGPHLLFIFALDFAGLSFKVVPQLCDLLIMTLKTNASFFTVQRTWIRKRTMAYILKAADCSQSAVSCRA